MRERERMSTSKLHKQFMDLAKFVVYVMELNNTPTPFIFIPYNQRYNNGRNASSQNRNNTRSGHDGILKSYRAVVAVLWPVQPLVTHSS
jgi:hypothetical protein